MRTLQQICGELACQNLADEEYVQLMDIEPKQTSLPSYKTDVRDYILDAKKGKVLNRGQLKSISANRCRPILRAGDVVKCIDLDHDDCDDELDKEYFVIRDRINEEQHQIQLKGQDLTFSDRWYNSYNFIKVK